MARIIGTVVLLLVLAGLYFTMEQSDPKPQIAPLTSSDSDFKNLKINP